MICILHTLSAFSYSLFSLSLWGSPSARIYCEVSVFLGWTVLPPQLAADMEGGEGCCEFFLSGGESWWFPGRLNVSHNESFHDASRNREDAGPARDSGYEAWSWSKELRGGMSPGCLHCRLPFPSTHVMPFVDLGLMMGSCFPSGDESLPATYNSSEALCVRGEKKKKKRQTLTETNSVLWELEPNVWISLLW